MKRAIAIAPLLMLLCHHSCLADQPSANPRELATELLDNKPLVIRIYDNWRKDPARYRLETTPIDNLNVRLNLSDAGKDAFVVITALDQTNEAVKLVLDDFIYIEQATRFSTRIHSIWPTDNNRRQPRRSCRFEDAFGNPLAGVTVEMWHWPLAARMPSAVNDERVQNSPRLLLGVGKLDDKSQLHHPRSLSSGWMPAFVVHHPDCGKVHARFLNQVTVTDETYRRFVVPAIPKEKWRVFKDATGDPIPSATVQILNCIGDNPIHAHPDLIATITLDDQGRLRPPAPDVLLPLAYLILSHPDYGTAVIVPQRAPYIERSRKEYYTLPLVAKDSPVYSRSIQAQVVDPNGEPVARAIIECADVKVAGAYGSISSIDREVFRSLTDHAGHFSMYLPIEKDTELHGDLIPSNAKYSLTIKAPGQLRLKDQSAMVSPGQNPVIKMVDAEPEKPAPAQQLYPRVFVFEHKGQIITDPARLEQTVVWVISDVDNEWLGKAKPNSSSRDMVPLNYETWSTLTEYPAGYYHATMSGPRLNFPSVHITADSPEVIVFRTMPTRVYTGSVVYADTSDPAADVVVAAIAYFSEFEEPLTTEEYRLLYDHASATPVAREILDAIKRKIRIGSLTKTDSRGYYRMEHVPGVDPYMSHITVLKPDYISSSIRCITINSVTDDLADEMAAAGTPGILSRQAETIKLFPAAILALEPNFVETTDTDYGVSIRLDIARDGNPEWLADYFELRSKNCLPVRARLRPTGNQRIHIPADVKMTVELIPTTIFKSNTVTIPDVKLKQGEFLDLGNLDFPPKITVLICVIDSKGKPLEGVAVRGFPPHGNVSVTDAEGFALFYVKSNSATEFKVGYVGNSPRDVIYESITCQIGGQADSGKRFFLTLSDSMVDNLPR